MTEITFDQAVEMILEKVSPGDLLCQLAEEASELAQAALKLRRAIEPGNPTPITKEEAEGALLEEFADVILSCQLLGLTEQVETVEFIHINKMERWIDRLQNGC